MSASDSTRGIAAVTVITIARDAEHYLGQALRSIEAQTLLPVEILVIVDQSSDRTLEVAHSFPSVRVLAGSGSGIAGARNTGIAHASADFIAFLDSDDLWCSSKLRTQCAFMANHPELAYSTTLMRYIVDGLPGTRARHSRHLLHSPIEGCTPSTLMVRRETFEKTGLFDVGYSVGADAEWFSRTRDLGLAGACLPHTLTFKRLHQGNASTKAAANRKDMFRIARRSIERRNCFPA